MGSIGRYRILGELGRGAMGIVYRAQDPSIGREVAIKTIRLSELSDTGERAKLRDRLFREAQSAGMLSHPGIVTIYDIAEEGDVAYIAMELVDGPTLDRMMASDPPSGHLVLSILSQTAAALDYAHKRGIVHRDIKPANIMVHDQRVAKITDFGVAKIQSHQMTQAGSMVGTPNYMSPEQIQGLEVDGRSDQFSLAVISYELLTGEKPFNGESIAALAYKIVRDDAAPVHRLNATLDWPVDTVIRRAMSKKPAERFPTCSDFVFALENACRACRKWTPLASGAAQSMATMSGVTAPVPLVKAKPAPAPAPPPAFSHDAETQLNPIPARKRDPMILRVLRVLTLIVIGGGLVAAMLVGALRFLQDRQEEAAASQAPAPPAAQEAPRVSKPSPMPELPGEAKPSPAEAQPEQAAEEPEALPTPARTTAPRKPAASTDTRLITNPPGALLVVDGTSTLSCQSPCNLMLSPGRHTLAATMAGYRRTLRILEIPRDNEVFMNLDRASGTVMIRSEPRGAAIFINGQVRPEKTPAMLTLPAGTYKVELELAGERESHQVQVRDSAITNLAVRFADR